MEQRRELKSGEIDLIEGIMGSTDHLSRQII